MVSVAKSWKMETIGPLLEPIPLAKPHVLCVLLAQKPSFVCLGAPARGRLQPRVRRSPGVPAPGRCSFAFICITFPAPSGPCSLRPSSPQGGPAPPAGHSGTAAQCHRHSPIPSVRRPARAARSFRETALKPYLPSARCLPASLSPPAPSYPPISGAHSELPAAVFGCAYPSVSNASPT